MAPNEPYDRRHLATVGGVRRHRTLTWAATAFSVAILGVTGVIIHATYRTAEAGQRAEVLFAKIIANAHRHSALEWQAMAEGELSAEILVQSDLARALMTRDLEQISWLGLPRATLEPISRAYDSYRAALEDEYHMLLDGDIASAERLDEEAVVPAFDRLQRAIEAAQPIVLEAARRGERAAETAVALMVGAGMGAVLLSALFFRARRRSELLEVQQEAAARMAAERRRLLDQAIRVAERERVLVANDLHDGPLQRLSALTFKLEHASGRLQRGDAEVASSLLASVQGGLADEIAAIRHVMRALRPPVLTESGLGAALQEHASSLQGSSGLRCTVETTLVSRLDEEIETVLYRVAQEALTNAIKHAGAAHISVSVTSENGSARLVVRDDGIGFVPADTAELVRAGHFGLASIRERVEMARGALHIESRPGGGTTLIATLPTHGGEP